MPQPPPCPCAPSLYCCFWTRQASTWNTAAILPGRLQTRHAIHPKHPIHPYVPSNLHYTFTASGKDRYPSQTPHPPLCTFQPPLHIYSLRKRQVSTPNTTSTPMYLLASTAASGKDRHPPQIPHPTLCTFQHPFLAASGKDRHPPQTVSLLCNLKNKNKHPAKIAHATTTPVHPLLPPFLATSKDPPPPKRGKKQQKRACIHLKCHMLQLPIHAPFLLAAVKKNQHSPQMPHLLIRTLPPCSRKEKPALTPNATSSDTYPPSLQHQHKADTVDNPLQTLHALPAPNLWHSPFQWQVTETSHYCFYNLHRCRMHGVSLKLTLPFLQCVF